MNRNKLYKQAENITESMLQLYPDNYRKLVDLMDKFQNKKMKLTELFEKVSNLMQVTILPHPNYTFQWQIFTLGRR